MPTPWRVLISRFGLGLLDFLLPQFCRFCGKAAGNWEDRALCADCAAKVDWVASPLCPGCGRTYATREGEDHLCGACQAEPPPFARARAAVIYDGPVAEAIKKFKYGRRLDLLPVMQYWLRQPACRKLVDAADLIVPVPLHARRLKERGFNQALLLAQSFSDKPLAREALIRVRHTVPQSGLNPRERRENVRKAFAAPRPEDLKGKNVLLVDDVYTTGATVRECARVLRRARASVVTVLTVARVRHD
jgi:ComF family protein